MRAVAGDDARVAAAGGSRLMGYILGITLVLGTDAGQASYCAP
jgi:hypothetical protein